ncbi:putative methyltransferase [Podospora australis]|uniref:Methyltransferase n=1 Tax=Podospora australis TaxID=1536484 RepID=A0AAN6WV05_9PEZI|nr:putative methyltransferase [Podospora australis]
MNTTQKTPNDPISRSLLQLSSLIQTTVTDFINQRESADLSVDNTKLENDLGIPSWPVFNAQRTLLAAAGKLIELVSSETPSSRLVEVAFQYFEARALHVIVDKRVPDILARHGGGLSVKDLSREVGIEAGKLSRLMRCLCSNHIFEELEEDMFANNVISTALVGNEPLRAYTMLIGLDVYSASDHLPRYLSDSVKGASYDVNVTPWQDAIGTTKSRWDWLEEKVKVSDLMVPGRNGPGGSTSSYPGCFGQTLQETIASAADKNALVPRPEHALFGLAMLGSGRVYGRAHLFDFPWSELGNATVVDVAGGVGSFSMELSRIYPHLKFVIQDREPVLKQGELEVWPKEHPEGLRSGRVRFMPHDMFKPNPIKAADVYWLRYIMHDWSDNYCVEILSAIKASMGPTSRILICDQVMNTTLGSPDLVRAPEPLPANWGYYTRFSHQRDLVMMSVIGGVERKPTEFKDIIERAGLKIRKIWDCRSQVGLIEVVLLKSEFLS